MKRIVIAVALPAALGAACAKAGPTNFTGSTSK